MKLKKITLKKFIKCLKLYLAFERWVTEPHRKSQVRRSYKVLGLLINLIKKCFPREDGWGWNLPKMHALSRMPHYMMKFGSANNFSGQIGEWALKNNLWVITDEIYEHLLYDGATAPSICVQVPELADRTIIINGVAKTYAMTGWRVGWMIGPKDLIKAATNLQSHLSSNVSNVSQRAAIAALTGDLAAVHKMGEAFDRRRKLIVKLLNEIPGVSCPTPTGAFYVYPSVKGVLGKQIRGKRPTTSAELATLILEEVEVAAVPGEAFGPSGYLRFSYALGDEDIVEGIGRVKKLLSEAI